jgi:hypothetical protein
VLWTHGALDVLVAEHSVLEPGALGAAGRLPGWPGPEVFPPQPMVTQIRSVLDAYAAAGGTVRMELLDGAAHSPHLDATERWLSVFTEFLAEVA